jgi:competence protein ComEC
MYAMAVVSKGSTGLKTPGTRQPLLWAALAFAAGIALGVHVWRPPLWWMIAILLLAASAMQLARHHKVCVIVVTLCVWFLLGALSIQLRPPVHIPDIGRFTNGSQLIVTGHVTREGYIREAGFGGLRQTIDIVTESVQSASETCKVEFGLRLGIFAKDSEANAPGVSTFRQFRYGQRVHFVAKLRSPRNYGNPGNFDYRGHLVEQGIVALGSAKAENVEILAGFSGSRMGLWRSQIHRRIIEKVHELWPEQQAALLDAAVVGESAFLDRNTRADFQRSGTYHILVVSGMNVSILAFVVFWTLRRLRAGELFASVLTVVLGVSYAFLTDVGAPVWRSTIMMAAYLAARLVYRDRSSLNALGAAALGLMIVDPKSLLDASFQLTFLSVLIVGALAIPVIERSSQPYRRGLRHIGSTDYDHALRPRVAQFRLDLRMIACRLAPFLGPRIPAATLITASRCGIALYDVLIVSGLIQLGLALPMAWYFHRATVIGLPANMLAVPLTEVLMPSAVLALALGFIATSVAKVPALIAGIALEGITGTVRGLGGLRLADFRLPLPDGWMVVGAMVSLMVSMLLARRRAAWSCLGLASLLLTTLWIALVPPRSRSVGGVAEITAIDVGEGDATLVIAPDRRAMLIDAGGMPGSGKSNFDIGEDVISPYLWYRRIRQLDVVVATHGHWDHVGGMRNVIANFRPRELWIGDNPPTPGLEFLVQHAAREGIVVRRFSAGDATSWGGLAVRALAPAKEAPNRPRRPNDDCLALKMTYGNTSVLLEGDSEKSTERELVQQNAAAGLLKVGHHGSSTSTSPELLVGVHPTMAVISVGRDNTYGHPRGDVLRRLEKSGASVYRTDLDGLVTFILDGASIKATALH